MTINDMSRLPSSLTAAELHGLEATLDCALFGKEGKDRDAAQVRIVTWINQLAGPDDCSVDAMNDAVYGLYGQVLIEFERREGEPVEDNLIQSESWFEQGLAFIDADSDDTESAETNGATPDLALYH